MLVLSRKTTEKICIGENITVEVRRVAGNRVTLAIEAPRDIRILRGELEKAAKEFEEQPAAASAETKTTEPLTGQTYTVTHKRVQLNKAIPPGDLSDHGLSAYVVG